MPTTPPDPEQPDDGLEPDKDAFDAEVEAFFQMAEQLPSPEMPDGERATPADPPIDQAGIDASELSDFLRLVEATLGPESFSEGSAGSDTDATWGPFRLHRVLGVGGTGVVFLAQEMSTATLLALKTPRPEAMLDPAARTRIQNEAEALSRLEHPNIVHIEETGEVGPVSYLAWRYVEGETLKARIQRQHTLSPDQAVDLLGKLAAAMHHAHERGILHGELSSSNILLQAANDEPLLSDFGLAMDPSLVTRGTDQTELTRYLAPEQLEGRRQDITIRTDVWALGVILYESLTGQLPFPGSNAQAVIQKVLHEFPIAPSSLRPAMDANLEAICLKCLDKQPERRYSTVTDFAHDLNAWSAGQPVQARPVGWFGRVLSWVKRRPVAIALVVLLALVVLTLAVTRF